jgi:hydrogenase nickel incorporation protein HypA/HybF
MHETTLAAQLLRRIERAARAEGAARVTAVRLRVGEFAGVEPELLRIGFLRLAAGTMAEGARLEVEPVPLEAECAECGLRFRVEAFRFACPACGSGRTRVVSGEEMTLEEMTIATGGGNVDAHEA